MASFVLENVTKITGLQFLDDQLIAAGDNILQEGFLAFINIYDHSMNMIQQHHKTKISVLEINQEFKKITTGDEQHQVVVYGKTNNIWYEEMINAYTVRSASWSSDGVFIALLLFNSRLVIGDVYGKLKSMTSQSEDARVVKWSANREYLLLGTAAGAVQILNDRGEHDFYMKVSGKGAVVSIIWFDSSKPYTMDSEFKIIITHQNGTIELFRNLMDSQSILIDANMTIQGARINPNGSVFCIYGSNYQNPGIVKIYHIDGQFKGSSVYQHPISALAINTQQIIVAIAYTIVIESY